MAGFRSDILKASILAVLLAISLGAAAYVLNYRIGTRMPTTTPAKLEAYTPRGGLEKNNMSSIYYYNETINIIAHVDDTWGNPVVEALVTFEINGPPGSSITITENARTNASGFALANLTVPYDKDSLEAVLGIWSAVATTQIAGSNITDFVAFQVKSPPVPYIDVYTDRGGQGLGEPSQSYSRNETVYLYAKVSNGTGPGYGLVNFVLTEGNGQIIPWATQQTNASGIATTSFRIPFPSEISTGHWQIVATVSINPPQVLIDILTFECS